MNIAFTHVPRSRLLKMPQKYLDISRYCNFHESNGHNTDDYVQLKDTIEQMMQEGTGIIVITSFETID